MKKKTYKILIISVSCLMLVVILSGVLLGALCMIYREKIFDAIPKSNMKDTLLVQTTNSFILKKIGEEFSLGNSADEVRDKIAEHENWEIMGDHERFYRDGTPTKGNSYRFEDLDKKIISDRYGFAGDVYYGAWNMEVIIGVAYGLEYVSIFFAFDEQYELVDIGICRESTE